MSGGGQDWCLWVGKARWLSPLAQVGGRSRLLVHELPISMGSWPANVRHGHASAVCYHIRSLWGCCHVAVSGRACPRCKCVL